MLLSLPSEINGIKHRQLGIQQDYKKDLCG